MKKTIHLKESELRSMIYEQVRGTLKEHSSSLKQPYFKLVQCIDEFIDALEQEGYVAEDLVSTLLRAKDEVDDFVRHPEGSYGQKIWDSVGF